MKKIMKRLFSFLRVNISLILFIIFTSMFLVMLTINTLENYEIEMVSNVIVNNCVIKEPIKTREQLLKEIQVQKRTINNLTEKCKSLESEINTYKENQKKNITTNTNTNTNNMNPHSKSNYTVEELNKMLAGTGLESQGRAFKDMEDTYNVNALFAMGVAMHESANGYKKANTHNYFGFRGNSGWMSFSSVYECIQYFGKLINKHYSDKTSIQAIQTRYCPDGSPWTQRVIAHMNQLKEKINI